MAKKKKSLKLCVCYDQYNEISLVLEQTSKHVWFWFIFSKTPLGVLTVSKLFLDSPEGILRRWLSQYRRHHRLLVCREVPPSGWSTRWTSNMVQRKSSRKEKKKKQEEKKWKILSQWLLSDSFLHESMVRG